MSRTEDELHDAAAISMAARGEGLGYAILNGYLEPQDMRTEDAAEAVRSTRKNLEDLYERIGSLTRDELNEAVEKFDL